MSKISSLYSSSSGNSTYIGNEKSGILVDIGKNCKFTENALENIGVSPESIKAIFITHEHIDHVSGLKVFLKKHNPIVFGSEGTINYLQNSEQIPTSSKVEIIKGEVEIGGLSVTAFKTFHDSVDSCGYKVSIRSDRSVAILTDTGKIDDSMISSIEGVDLILLETNHEIEMLLSGAYPYTLKRRILSDYGHLSNDMGAEIAQKLFKTGTNRFILGHLSSQNNTPEISLKSVKNALISLGAVENKDYTICVAGKNDVMNPIIL